MDSEDRRLIANGAMAFALCLTVGLTAWILVPAAQHATAPAPLFLKVTGISLAAGIAAGLAIYALCAWLEENWRASRAIAFGVVLVVATLAANVSLAGWVHLFQSMPKPGTNVGQSVVGAQSFEQYRSHIIEDRIAYRNELNAAGYPGFLTFKALGAPGGFKAARKKIVTVRGIIQTYQDRFQEQEIALRAGAIAGAVTAKEQRAGMERLKKIMGPELKDREDWWQATAAIAAEQEAFLTDLVNADAAWEFKDVKLIFHSDKDVARFQSHVERVKTLQDQAHKLDLAIAHESDQADEAMLGATPASQTRVGWRLGTPKP